MKSLQRLQQHLLATDALFEHNTFALTSRAQRLRTSFRRGIAVGVTATAAFGAIGTDLYMKTGPGTFDPQKIFAGDTVSSQRMAQIYDTHRNLLHVRERIHEIKTDMIQGQSRGNTALTLQEQACQLRAARAQATKIAQEFEKETHGLTPQQVHYIIGDDLSQHLPPDAQPEAIASAQEVSTARPASPAPRRFRP